VRTLVVNALQATAAVQDRVIEWLGRTLLLASVVVPKMLSSFSKADLVHTMNRPTWPPGASCRVHLQVCVGAHSRTMTIDSHTPDKHGSQFDVSTHS
jgi:hypothetical protein